MITLSKLKKNQLNHYRILKYKFNKACFRHLKVDILNTNGLMLFNLQMSILMRGQIR